MKMNVSRDEIVKILKSKGLRVTPQRFAVYANLRSREDHPTAEQILSDLNQYCPISSQATVYSALQVLRDVKLIREILLQEGVSRYDAKITPHHHFRCQQCEKIEDIPWNTFPVIDLNRLPGGLKGNSYEITIQGVCEACQKGDHQCERVVRG